MFFWWYHSMKGTWFSAGPSLYVTVSIRVLVNDFPHSFEQGYSETTTAPGPRALHYPCGCLITCPLLFKQSLCKLSSNLPDLRVSSVSARTLVDILCVFFFVSWLKLICGILKNQCKVEILRNSFRTYSFL